MDDDTPNTGAKTAQDEIESDMSHSDLEDPFHASDEDDMDPDYEPQASTSKVHIWPGLNDILDITNSDVHQHINFELEEEKDEEKENIDGDNTDPALIHEIDHRSQNKEEGKRLTRKRKRDPEKWKRNINKHLCEHGREYRDVKGNLKKQRKPKLEECKCKFKCGSKISVEKRKKIHEEFWLLSNEGKLHFYNKNIIHRPKKRSTVKDKDSRRHFSYQYYFHLTEDTLDDSRLRVCKAFFLGTLDVSQRRISYFFEQNRSEVTGTPKEIRQGKHTKKRIGDEDKNLVRDHINSIPRIESHYCRMRNNKEYFESTLNFSRLYNLYREWCVEKNITPVKKSFYRNIFNYEFNIAFLKPKSDRCDICEEYRILKNKSTEGIVNMEKFTKHSRSKEICKLERDRDRQLSNNTTAIICFDMENVFALPRSNISCFFYSKKLNTYNLTAHCNINRIGYCAIWSEGMHGRKGIDIASALISILKKVSIDIPNINEFILWSDSCVPQNRNSIMSFALKKFMEEFPQVTDITQKFSEPGHSQIQEVDNLHSQIEKRLKGMEIPSPLSLIRILPSVNQKRPLTAFHMQQQSFKDYEEATKKINFKVVPYASVKVLKYLKAYPTKIFYKKEHNEVFSEADLTFRIGTRSRKIHFTLPEVRPCPTPKQCLLPEDKVVQLYQLFKYIPDIDKKFLKCMFYEYKNGPPDRKKKSKQGPKTK